MKAPKSTRTIRKMLADSGEVTAEMYPTGWLERAEALKSGAAVAGDQVRNLPRWAVGAVA